MWSSDVETHEPEVLEAVGEILKRDRPRILIEILTDEVGRRVEPFFAGPDYHMFRIDEGVGPQEVTAIRAGESRNYLLCPQESSEYAIGNT